VQAVAPLLAEKDPEGHRGQSEDARSDALLPAEPAGHGTGAAEPSGQKPPTGQGEGALVLILAQRLPEGQSSQAERPVDGAYEPGEQLRHEDASKRDGVGPPGE
jgi:hypothetical protein